MSELITMRHVIANKCSSNVLNEDHKGSLTTEEEVWLTSPQAAQVLGITVQALMNKVSNGHIPYSKLGRRNRYNKKELLALLSKNRKGPIYGD